MIEQGAKILLKKNRPFVAVLWEARRSPRVAGMMLTFPALNGISMLMTTPAELEEVAGTMLLLPVLNGVMSQSSWFCLTVLSTRILRY